MNTKTAFALGPVASPFLLIVLNAFVSIFTGFQDGVIALVKTTIVIFFTSLVYSYIFSIVFGLPVYFYIVKKGWASWFSFNVGAIVSTGILGVVMVVLNQNEYKLQLLFPVTFFAIVNANLMWYLINKTANTSFKNS